MKVSRWVAAVSLLTACTATPTSQPTTVTSAAPTTSSVSEATTTSTVFESTTTSSTTTTTVPVVTGLEEFSVPAGSRPHDVAPAADGTVWYTAQRAARMGRLDPSTGEIEEVPLGSGSAPHGVIVGPDAAAWVTDGGLNAIVRVDHQSLEVSVFPVPFPDANLNTGVFHPDGSFWFTGQTGMYGRFDPGTEQMEAFQAPRGRGPYGITVTPDGQIFYASLAGSHIARIETATGQAQPIEPPTEGQGARRVWSDSAGRIWVSEWNAGQLGRYDPDTGEWVEWPLPGDDPRAYAVYVDETDRVWVSDFGGDHALHRFDPASERFESFPLPSPGGGVRQLLGRPGEVWGAESASDALVVARYQSPDFTGTAPYMTARIWPVGTPRLQPPAGSPERGVTTVPSASKRSAQVMSAWDSQLQA